MSAEAISHITERGGNGRNGDGTWPPTDGKGCPLCGAIGGGAHGGGCTNQGKRYDEQGKCEQPAQLHVEFSEISASGSTRNGTVYGINAGTGKPMVAWASGARDLSYDAPAGAITVPRISEEDAELARRLRDARRVRWDTRRSTTPKTAGQLRCEVGEVGEVDCFYILTEGASTPVRPCLRGWERGKDRPIHHTHRTHLANTV
jgi:hypothetical protein